MKKNMMKIRDIGYFQGRHEHYGGQVGTIYNRQTNK